MMNGYEATYVGGNLATCLMETLGGAFALYVKAHGHHWNVMGPDFHEYHGFFSEIYSDVYGSIDPLAENMRKLGAIAPSSVAQLAMLNPFDETDCGCDPRAMCLDLYAANNAMIEMINDAIRCAMQENEQGIANFLAERDDAHKKWRWQLASILTEVGVADSCALCSPRCMCPGSHGGQCNCSSECHCSTCSH